MKYERIEVRTRDDYRGCQEPIGYFHRGVFHTVVQVIDRWYEARLDATRVPLRYYKVVTDQGRVHLLRYHELFCAWSILVRDPPAGEPPD